MPFEIIIQLYYTPYLVSLDLYNIELFFEGCKPSLITEIKSSSCSASTEHNSAYICENAYDGDTAKQWATLNQGVGAWIKINFEGLYRLTKISVMQRPYDEYFKEISIEFTDGTPVDFTLPYTYPSHDWADIDLTDYPDMITTGYVNISVKSVYREANNGFSEVKVYGCGAGKITYLNLLLSCL